MTGLAAGLGMFLTSLDIAVNVALPLITREFGTDYQTVQWIIIVFIATRAGLVLGAGSFADRFGLRQVYLLGAAAYLAAMICIALSPNFGSVVGFRVLQALGTGCLFAASPAIAARLFPMSRRGLSMGLTTGSQALGMLAGTLGAVSEAKSVGRLMAISAPHLRAASRMASESLLTATVANSPDSFA